MKKAVLIFFVIAAAAFAYEKTVVNIPGTGSGYTLIEVDKGDSFRKVTEKLVKSEVISSPLLFEIAARLAGADVKIRAGEYLVPRNLSIKQVIARLVEGKTVLRPVTIPEGYNIRQTGEELERRGFMTADSFVSVAFDHETAKSLNIPAESVEGYLFPDTYHFSKRVSAREVISKMVKTFFIQIPKVVPADVISDPGKLHRAITLASMIEKETAVDRERKLISAVFTNRLEKRMLLQCDPTVIYGLPGFDGNLRRKDLTYDSPYNTYRYRGLPPGPIANPGLASIDSALRPADVKYIYFVSKNNGEHHFSGTLKEHNRAVWKYQVKNNR